MGIGQQGQVFIVVFGGQFLVQRRDMGTRHDKREVLPPQIPIPLYLRPLIKCLTHFPVLPIGIKDRQASGSPTIIQTIVSWYRIGFVCHLTRQGTGAHEEGAARVVCLDG